MDRGGRRRSGRALRAHARHAFLTLLSVLLLNGALSAGSRYFFCQVMAELRAAPCCVKAASHGAMQIEGADCACCHAEALPRLPIALRSAPPPSLDAPELCAPDPAARSLRIEPAGAHVRALWRAPPRAGPPPEIAHTRLLVFLV